MVSLQWFAAVDTDRSGRISVTELQEALLLGNLQFSLAVCAQMIRYIPNCAGAEFCLQTLGFKLCKHTCPATCRLHDRSSTNSLDMQDFMALHKFLEEMNQSFQMHDQDCSGSLNANETHSALTSAGKQQQLTYKRPFRALTKLTHIVTFAGFNLEPPAFAEMCRAFDPERKGQISYAPYIAMTLFLRCAANAFQAFDSSKMGRVNLDFSQFIYAASNCR